MCYLHTPHLLFTGDFQADVSTVNNDVRHYDVENFRDRFQEEKTADNMNGGWNPNGSSIFRFIDCTVKRLTLPGIMHMTSSAEDIVIGQKIAGSDDRSFGKLVDLDPQMQMASELWGVTLRLFTAGNETLLQGNILPAAFRDLQLRQYKQAGLKNGEPLGASWSSVLYNLKWGKDADKSPFLKMLRSATCNDKLSIQLTSFGYYYSHKDGRFSMGKIIGVLGSYLEGEPELFPPTRRLYGVCNFGESGNSGLIFNYSNFLVDHAKRNLVLDLGGSFPLTNPLGRVEARFSLSVAVATIPINITPDIEFTTIATDKYVPIGELEYEAGTALMMNQGGLFSFQLTDAATHLLKDHQLMLLWKTPEGKAVVMARESMGGYLVRASQFVLRLDAGQQTFINLFAYRWGNPLQGATIQFTLQPPIQPGVGSSGPDDPASLIPFTGKPGNKLKFSPKIKTDGNGKAVLQVSGSNPGNPRHYVDGQVYNLLYQLKNVPGMDRHELDLIFIHLRNDYKLIENPTWQDVAPVWAQFDNLYPVMSKHLINMKAKEELVKKKEILLFAFTRDIHDPLYMPVSRDLSQAKIKTLINWLLNPSEKKPKPRKKRVVKAPAAISLAGVTQATADQVYLEQKTREKAGYVDAPSIPDFPDHTHHYKTIE